MNEPSPRFLELGASIEEAELSVLLMHGLGADGHDFEDVAAALIDAALPRKWRFVLPHAPEMAVTINMGTRMPAWYDILQLDHPRAVNWETVAESERLIANLIEREQADNILLAGFSQGGAMALHVGLRRQSDIAGILVMSGYLLESDAHPCPAQKTDLPVALFHGKQDPVVPLEAAEQTVSILRGSGFSPDFKAYEGLPHSVSEEEIRDVFDWMSELS